MSLQYLFTPCLSLGHSSLFSPQCSNTSCQLLVDHLQPPLHQEALQKYQPSTATLRPQVQRQPRKPHIEPNQSHGPFSTRCIIQL
ncbi:hypothetical protein L873DRAFT_275711 [Choiromyces venosus 120613-1]|uniref:Uncharacterized protein n=1 Tax=Choiromyces venosus 120613-1 TaxID=1336337 RepID=A0A3N4JXI4_9PEZI|nr:hypothetical protein L873DRAFT_275711 [Choiromyces venosus 120613-1]